MPTRILALLLVAGSLCVAPLADAAAPKSLGTLTVVGEDGLAGLPIVAFQGGARTTTPSGGGGNQTGKIAFDTFTVTRLVDAASPRLLDLTFKSKGIDEVRIELPLKKGGVVTYVLSSVSVVVNERHTPIGGPPLEDVGFAAQQVREIVTGGNGSVTSCMNVVTQGPCP